MRGPTADAQPGADLVALITECESVMRLIVHCRNHPGAAPELSGELDPEMRTLTGLSERLEARLGSLPNGPARPDDAAEAAPS